MKSTDSFDQMVKRFHMNRPQNYGILLSNSTTATNTSKRKNFIADLLAIFLPKSKYHLILRIQINKWPTRSQLLFFILRYNEGLKTNEYRDISAELARECYDMFQKSFNAIDGANSWYETSSNGHEYEKCEGEQNLGWKDKGYVTLFGLLQVEYSLQNRP